jgi:Amt family ammonium transporter
LFIGLVAGALFVWAFHWTQEKLKVDDVLGVWPLHGLCGLWGALAVGIFGSTALGGLGGVSFMSQLVGSLVGLSIALIGGFIIYGLLKIFVGIRLTEEEEFNGADLSIHRIRATHDK